MIPIHVDRNVRPSDYDDQPSGTLLVTSVFYTFQGEGPFAGQPAVFVRLAGCNIGAKADCRFCDTRFEFDRGEPVDYVELIERIEGLIPHRGSCLVVITGGEPLLQHNRIREFIDLAEKLGHTRFRYQVETNGTLLRVESCDSRISYVVSPKVPFITGRYGAWPSRWGTDARMVPGNLAFKFVVGVEGAADEYSGLPMYHILLPREQVFVSGITVYKRALHDGEISSVWDQTLVDHDATRENYKHAAQVALKHGYRVSYQTHLMGVQE